MIFPPDLPAISPTLPALCVSAVLRQKKSTAIKMVAEQAAFSIGANDLCLPKMAMMFDLSFQKRYMINVI
jgi:hypothetical protein